MLHKTATYLLSFLERLVSHWRGDGESGWVIRLDVEKKMATKAAIFIGAISWRFEKYSKPVPLSLIPVIQILRN